MSQLDSMLQRNKALLAQQSDAGTLMPSMPRAMPNVRAIIIGCADMRVDPGQIFGLKTGEAVVIRNIGGRVDAWAAGAIGTALGRLARCSRKPPGGGGEFHLVT